MNKKKLPYIHLEFKEPSYGYWDGGKKSGGDFTPERINKKEVKWGCWFLNFYFTSGFGLSWIHAASIAKCKLDRMTRPTHSVYIVTP